MKVPLGFHSRLAVVLAVDDAQRCSAGAKEMVLCSLIFRGKVIFVVHAHAAIRDSFVSDVDILN